MLEKAKNDIWCKAMVISLMLIEMGKLVTRYYKKKSSYGKAI